MATLAAVPQTEPRKLKGDAELKRELQQLCRTDNVTNWYYLARACTVLAVSIGGTIWSYYFALGAGISLWWCLPIYLTAVAAIGASMHQLAGATHEATHHTLFKNRLLNELVSDWLCMFPLFSSTYTFRLYHLIHHQFVNDPDHDPDFVVLAKSGHWMNFPVTAARFLWMVASQIFLVGLLRYIAVRFRYNSIGVDSANVYQRKEKGSKIPRLVGTAWLIGMFALSATLYFVGNPILLAAALPLYWLGLFAFHAMLPERYYETARLRPVIAPRWMAASRTFFLTALIGSLTVGQMSSGLPLWRFFVLLWVVPVLTAFPFFMILRQVVQHGNGDRGWLTNTRTFLVNPLIRYAVFPFGMDYHLPHHMYATVPHYNLPKLHAFLMSYPEYQEQGIVVENYFFPKSHHHGRPPTVVEVLGPEYARQTDEVYIDDTVLDGWEVDEKDEILGHSRRKAAVKPK